MKFRCACLVLLASFTAVTVARTMPHNERGRLSYFSPETGDEVNLIGFANGFSIDTRTGESRIPAELRLDENQPGPAYYIVQFTGPIVEDWYRQLRRLGVEPFGYLPHYAVLAKMDAGQKAGVASLPMVRWVGLFQPAYKLHDVLLDASGIVKLVVVVAQGEAPDAVIRTAAALGAVGEVLTTRYCTSIVTTLDASAIPELARLQEVSWIERWSEVELDNNNCQWVTQTGWRTVAPADNDMTARKAWNNGVRGQNLILSTSDTGINVSGPGHDMFRDPAIPVTPPYINGNHRKVVAYKLYGTATVGEADYHGSHVNGTVAGNDDVTSNTSYRDGMSLDAKLYFVDVQAGSGPLVLPSDKTAFYDTVHLGRGLPNHVLQHSGSWSSDNFNGTYLLSDASTDNYCWHNKDFLNIYSAGNDGSPGPSVGNPGIAKDVITVGATQNGTASNAIASFSSRGPTQDNRVKPTLCAPGQTLWSATATGTNTYAGMQGTSMSCPAVNGAVGLIRCYLAEGYYPTGAPVQGNKFTYISSALLRSMAVVSCDPNVGAYVVPSNDIGWGRIDIDSVLFFTGDLRKLSIVDEVVGVATGETEQWQFQVNSDIPLRVALAWTDSAAAPNANPTIVNNLHLELLAPSGTWYRGNQYTAGVSTVNPGTWDNRNVEECARINNPELGIWTIRVSGQNVPTGPRQPFAYAITGDISTGPTVLDAECVNIVAPTGTVNQGTLVTPQATVRNNGNTTQTFDVKFDIAGGYTNTQSVTLASGAQTVVNFTQWTAGPLGSQAVRCSTRLTGDGNNANDRQTGTVLVQSLDAECVSITAPTGTVSFGTLITPQATVRNNGNTSQTFDVRFEIAGGYTNTQSVTLAGGAQTVVNFTQWTAGPPGTLATKCTTRLTGDQDNSNDRQTGSVTVQALDAQCVSIVAPTGTVNQGTLVTPQATVRNNSNSVQTFNVLFEIAGGYSNTQPVTLAAGAQTTVSFLQWTAGPPGTQATKCTTQLTGDQVNANDKQTGTVFVQALDAQCVSIVAPTGTVNQGTLVTPQATVRNNSNTTQTFDVLFEIAGGYSNTQSVTLASGAQTVVNFLQWTAGPLGSQATKCTTRLAGDQFNANDKQTGSVFVQTLEAQCLNIVAPTGTVNQGSLITPQATIRNNGNSTQTFDVLFEIAGGYSNTQSVTLASGAQTVVNFLQWTAGPPGNLATKCTTRLNGDVNNANDRQTGSVTVQTLDAECLGILSPSGTVSQGMLITPRATVRNNGNSTQTFDVRFEITGGYANTQQVTLASGAQTIVNFLQWTAGPPGNLATKCTTRLAGDLNNANDKQTGSVSVELTDAECLSIIAPTGTVNQGVVVTPQATVRNNSNTAQTFDVLFEISGGYSNTQSVTLASGAQTIVNFLQWTAGPPGSQAAKCTTRLTGDQNTANNRRAGTVFVRVLDAECVSIVAPSGNVNQGAVITPQATIRNRGNAAQVFDVLFEISGGYSNTQSVTLAGGAQTVVNFLQWTAGPPGSQAVKCTTRLAGDQDNSNDRKTGTAFVQTLDALCVNIVAPTGTVNQGVVVTPQATVRNNSNTAQTFDVLFEISGGYSNTQSVTLASGAQTVVNFLQWNAGPAGSQTVKCTTRLTGDQVNSNDRQSGAVFVQLLDAECVNILAPVGTVNQGAAVTPRAVVRNNGNTEQTFDVLFEIDGGYSSTKPITLAGGAQSAVDFDQWIAGPPGSQAVRCTTRLAGDQSTGNDKKTGTVVVQTLDAECVSIIAPTGTVNQGQAIVPQAMIRNNGNTARMFDVLFEISGGYSSTKSVTLWPGVQSIVDFDQWVAGPAGSQTVKCTTQLAGDQNNANDRQPGAVFVLALDAQTVSIDLPTGTVPLGQAVTPRATVRNNGNTGQTFDVLFGISGGYSSTRSVTLAAGAQTPVDFDQWTAGPAGTQAVRCTTRLAGDQNTGNDRVTGEVLVLVLDAQTVSIDAPTGTVLQGSINAVWATVRNAGNTAQSFDVRFRIADGSGYDQTITTAVLDPGAQQSLQFPDWTASFAGSNFVTRCSTRLAGDLYPDNDGRSGLVTVVLDAHPDIAAVEILAPQGEVLANTEVVPLARYRNEGDVQTGFVAWFMMNSPADAEVYREQVTVAALAVGAETTIVFPPGNVGGTVGDWVARCSCYAASDVDPADDAKDGSFIVIMGPQWPFGWQEVGNVPGSATVKDGGWLVAQAIPSGHTLIYMAKGNKTTEFYSYDPIGGSWVSLTPINPDEEGRAKPPRKGCVGVSDGQGGIYMVKGNNTLGFWKYDIAANSWTRLADVPLGGGKKVRGGGDLAYAVTNDTGWVYFMKGGATEFYRFNPQTSFWDTCDNVLHGIAPKYGAGSFLAYDGGGYLYAHQAKYTNTEKTRHYMFKYDLATQKWLPEAGAKGMPVQGMDGGKMKLKKSKDGGSGAWYDGMMYSLKGGNTCQFYRYKPLPGDSWTELDTMRSFGSTAKKKKVKGGGDLTAYGYGAFFALKGNKTNEFWRYVQPTARIGVMANLSTIYDVRLSISPNPLTAGFAAVRYTMPKAGPVTVRVVDIAGRSVFSTRTLGHLTARTLPLDLRKVPAGVYLVRLDADGYSTSQKLVVQR